MQERLLTPEPYVKVALPVPMRTLFEYKVPKAIALRHQLLPGMRLKVPFGKQTRLGIIVELCHQTEWDPEHVKPFTSLHDESPIMPTAIMDLCNWASRYYHHPIGEVFFHALPALLRKGESDTFRSETWWLLTELGQKIDLSELKRAPKQLAFLNTVNTHPNGLSPHIMRLHDLQNTTAKALEEKGLIQRELRHFSKNVEHHGHQKQVPPTLNNEQASAVNKLVQSLGRFNVALLDGITGSGKTEVYLRLIETVIKQDQQVFLLVPEIGLTPQTLKRFEDRFTTDIVLLHSNMTDRERLDGWLMARSGKAKVIIGTRSSIFVPAPYLSLIILDEEHDASYKQQDGFRFHARDLALIRAKSVNASVILGSATPSYESLHNAAQNKFQWIKLRQRAGSAIIPSMERIDLRGKTLVKGFCETTLEQINTHLKRKEQVLIFLNRRGYAPTLMCHDCGWIATCQNCDVNLTVHKRANKLHCHHCGHHEPLINQCAECHSHEIVTIGEGTEQVETQLAHLFKDTPVLRIDRDSTSRKESLNNITQKIHEHDKAILVGTQMLAKGHHFPNVTLVVVMDADVGLFSSDFRGMERTAQLITQVAGRAGRASKPGHVLLQTYHPENPAIESLCTLGYEYFATQGLQERKTLGLPPYLHQVLIRSESVDEQQSYLLLEQVRLEAEHVIHHFNYPIQVMGPYSAIIVRKAGQHRYIVTFKSENRAPLHQLISQLAKSLEQNPLTRKVRYAIDVDPLETY
ncbi:primosomal protein N' [Marinomonas algicola]|uniref:primosomal protein N' n=1 Tax=Marinomonas algicola TaxID=2773454 RepID=UPI0017493C5A|nr:primosomal protein N' [Marinomonas algicola]